MEVGSLVEQCDGSAERRVGTVRALDETQVVVEWEGGESEYLPLPIPESVRTLAPGTIRYRAATDLAALQGEFEDNPIKVLVELLRELGERITITALRKHVASTGIVANMSLDEWGRMHQLLRERPDVQATSKGSLRWSGDESRSRGPRRPLSTSEALRKLADTSRRAKATRQSWSDVVSAGLDELSPYERLAAHALDVPVTEWPQRWTEPLPEHVPEEIRLVAVEHITEVSRARVRVVLPGTEPSPAARKSAEIPSSLDLLPLLVPLAAMPAPSLAADRAAKALSGEHARNALRAGMECFERALSENQGSEAPADREERLIPLLTRAKGLLKTVLMRRPKEDDTSWLEFVEEMADRACALLADPRTEEQSNEPVREWAQHVAEHPAIPVGIRQAAITRQASAAEADASDDSETADESLDAEAGPEVPTTLAGESGTAGVEEVDDAVAPSDAAITADDPPLDVQQDVQDETPEASREPERNRKGEIADLTRLLEEERSRADAARSEYERQRRAASAALDEAEAAANRLRLRLEEEERRRGEAEKRVHVAEAKWESAQRDLAEAAQRVEAMSRQVRRRDDELRQSRQTARSASQAQLRQARIDTLRVLAAVLAEVADQAVHEGEETGPANALYRRALARAAAAGVLDIGVPGEETDYDPVIHRAPGGSAARVVVERPGFVWQGRRESEPVVLEHAIVRRAER